MFLSLDVEKPQFKDVMTYPPTRRTTFSLNLKTRKVVSFLELEKVKADLSKTSYLNELLDILSEFPVLLALSPSSMLDELIAIRQLLNDDVMQQIPHLAAATRRDPVQMLLHLVEKGLAGDEQLADIPVPPVSKQINGSKQLVIEASSLALDENIA